MKIIVFVLFPLIGFFARAQNGVTATLGKVELRFSLGTQGEPAYAVKYGGMDVIKWSKMGFVLSVDSAFFKGFDLVGTEQKTLDDLDGGSLHTRSGEGGGAAGAYDAGEAAGVVCHYLQSASDGGRSAGGLCRS